jgi:hypothetical protein
MRFLKKKRAFVLVDEVFFVETDTIGWYQTYKIRHYLDSENSNFFLETFSVEEQKILLSFVFTTFLFLSFLASKKIAHGVSGVGTIGMSNEILSKNQTKGTFSLFYNFYWHQTINNSIHYGSNTISKVSPSSYANSIRANVNIKNPSKDDIFILFQIVNAAILKKSNYIKTIKKVSINSLNLSSFKNHVGINPIYSQIKRITKSSVSISFIEIIDKELKKLLVTYVILDSLRIIGQKDFGPEMKDLTPFLQREAEEEKAFQQFLAQSGIDTNNLSPKELNRLRNKWRHWRNWSSGWKSLVSFMRYLWYLFFKKVKSFKEFCKEFIQKNSYLILLLKVILSISMILLVYHFSLKKLNILKKENLILLSEIKNVTKDFQKKSLEILGEKQLLSDNLKLLSDNLDKQLLAIVEEKKSLQRLLEICELTSQEDLKRMTYQLHQVRNKFQSIMDQVSNKTE